MFATPVEGGVEQAFATGEKKGVATGGGGGGGG